MALIGPRTGSFEVTAMPLVAELVEIASSPLALMVAVVPAEIVPAAEAAEMALCRLAMVSPAAAVKLKVPAVDASLIVVTEPGVSGEVRLSGAAVDPLAEV